MKSFSALLSKGEALAKQVAKEATVIAEKAKHEDWVKQVANQMNGVCFHDSLRRISISLGSGDNQIRVQAGHESLFSHYSRRWTSVFVDRLPV